MSNELEKLSNYYSGGPLIIRNAEDRTYPSVEESVGFSWCRTNFYKIDSSGLQLLLGFETAVVDRAGFWKLLPSSEEDYGQDESKFHRIKIKQIGCVEEECIVRVQLGGDDYYTDPHVVITITDYGEWFAPYTFRRVASDEMLDPAKRL